MRLKQVLTILFIISFVKIASAGDESSINEKLTVGGNVTLPAGTFVISNSIVIHSNTVLQGTIGPTGEKETIIQVQAHAGLAEFVPLVSVTNAINIVIKDLIIDGNRDNYLSVGSSYSNGKAWGHGLYNDVHFIDCDNIEVYNCEFRNGLGDGVRTKYCTNVKFHDNTGFNLGHDFFLWGGLSEH